MRTKTAKKRKSERSQTQAEATQAAHSSITSNTYQTRFEMNWDIYVPIPEGQPMLMDLKKKGAKVYVSDYRSPCRALVLLVALAVLISTSARADVVYDGFETKALNTDIWSVRQAPPAGFWLENKRFREGKQSLAFGIRVQDLSCDNFCQRTEIRLTKRHRILFGTDAWYSFSFFLMAETPIRENTRWVTGQWKQDGEGSPFLAQRFEHGVFHITVQDGNCRVLVAQSSLEILPIPDTKDLENQAGEFPNRATRRHSFLSDKYLYKCSTDIKVQQSADPTLPEPFGSWIDMKYRVRAGLDGMGLVEIWANGKFIARVTGSIGYPAEPAATQYFKFGIYRDVMEGNGLVYLDDFKRETIAP
tara:strand:+ start:154 stop:1233 length:1080 start_codon:yes stop_codon:yes gene_type:complete